MNAMEKRAIARAKKALKAGGIPGNDQKETLLKDLLCDLRHWADETNTDFYFALSLSYVSYRREKKG
jgi:hypothetical protein